jgi:hypothetical protein
MAKSNRSTDDCLDDRWELTDKAIAAEELADKIAKTFWLDRDSVFDLIVDEENERNVR